MKTTSLTKSLTTLLLLSISGSILAQETPMWIRRNSISPDGTTIAFSYKGDIFTVPVEGGDARQITSNNAYDTTPMWTADSKEIIFASNREGSKDIFKTSAKGGTPKRITDYPGNEEPLTVLPDGRIIFIAYLQADAAYGGFPSGPQVYITAPEGGRPKLVSSMTIPGISVSNDGTVLYEDYKGYEDPLRKHHTSSVTRDIWVYKGASLSGDFKIGPEGTFTKISSFKGEDRNPVFAADGDTFYYLSEENGKNINLFRSSLSAPEKKTQLTFEEKNPVRFISVAANGTVAYSLNGEIYTIKEGSSPQKVAITVRTDENESALRKINLSGNATDMAVSPDGKEIAIIIRGDVFVTSTEYNTTRRITNTPSRERDLSFSKDGRTIYYSAERNGHWGIWKTSLTDKKEKNFTYALKMKEELFSDQGQTCFIPKVSPDGKMVAFLRDRTELVVKPADGGETKSLIKGANYSYADGDLDFEWSPDSRYLLSSYQADGRWNNDDIALVEIKSGKITDLTLSGYSDIAFRWALGGKAMTWASDKDGYRSHGSWGSEHDVYIMFFDGKAMTDFFRDKEDKAIEDMLSKDKKKDDEDKDEKKDSTEKKKVEKLKLDLEGRENRIFRLSRASGRYMDYYLTQDGSKLFYIAPLENGYGLCMMDLEDKSVNVVARGVTGSIIPSKDDRYLYIFSTYGGINRISVEGGSQKRISFSGDFEYKPKEEREYIFNHIWKQVKEKFYTEDLHGVDWNYYKENYSKFLPYINNDYDFASMLSEMLGELNGSHTGARYYAGSGEILAKLGAIYDYSYEGDGLKIKEILPDGPLNLADSEIKAGDVILAIDGNEIKAGKDWFRYLAGKAGKKTAVTVKKGHKKVELFLNPIPSEDDLLYKRWVRQREEMVKKLSGGKIGYVHIEGMDSGSFRELYSKALGKYLTCDALIVDTRHNGGGWLHDDLVTFLSGKEYNKFIPRGQYIGHEPFNKWTKPSCVLIGEDNYSDASGFPYAYKAFGIGKLIGAPVPGTMTAVWWESQINSSIVFGIPQVGTWGNKDGRFLENFQIEPDVLVYNDPASELSGKDIQLETAVKEMLKEIQ